MSTALELLLVEDNEGDIILTQRAFDEAAIECNMSVANDGVEAMEYLHKQGKFGAATTPNLILLDLNMPRMDGKKFLETVKADSQLRAIPVVMFTSSESEADIRECYQRQASCYVVKPFEFRNFVNAVKQIINFWNCFGKLPPRQFVVQPTVS